MDTWICDWHVIHSASRRRGTIAVAVLTLPRLDQIYAAVLSTPIEMCSKGAIRGMKRWRLVMYAASSKSLIVKKPW